MADQAAGNLADFYDAELALHNAHFRVAAAVGRSDHVLDIGCGAGQTTRDAARAAEAGRAHGIDLSSTMLQIARRRSAQEGLPNATFEVADAQNHVFAEAEFDLLHQPLRRYVLRRSGRSLRQYRQRPETGGPFRLHGLANPRPQ